MHSSPDIIASPSRSWSELLAEVQQAGEAAEPIVIPDLEPAAEE